jgi:hypothetical protein
MGSSLLMIFFSAHGVALQFDLTGLLTRHIRTEFLALSVVLGYLLLFLLFYSTNAQSRHVWDSLEWAERFFVGFLLGMFVLFGFSIGVDSIVSYLNERVLLQNPWDPVHSWILSTFIVLIIVVLVRLEIAQPINNESAVKRLQGILANPGFRALFFGLPICLFVVLAASAFSSLVVYGLTGNILYRFWIGLLSASFWFVLFAPWLLIIILAGFGSYFSPTATHQAPSVVLRQVLIEARRLVDLAKCPAQLVQGARNVCAQVIMKRTLFALITVTVLLGTLMPLVDAQLGLYAPRVEYVEMHVDPVYTIVGYSMDDYSVVVKVSKTFFISSPRLWFIRNITIVNPSNNSYFEDSQHPYWHKISSSLLGSGATSSTLKGPEGRVAAYNVTFQPRSDTVEVALVTTYYDRMDYPVINKTTSDIDIGNNTARREIHLVIHNPFDKPLSLDQLQIMAGPEITRVTCTENSQILNCTDLCLPSKQCLYLVLWQPLQPGESLNLMITVEFKR